MKGEGRDFCELIDEPRCEKIGLRGFDQVRHKPSCTDTEDG